MIMKPFNWRIPLGLVLVVLGVLAFLQSFGFIVVKGDPWALIFAVIFAALGLVFLYALVSDRSNWWAAIPGMTLLGLGALIGLALIPGFPDLILPVVFMGSIAASFWIVYLMNRQFWWAIIPAGTLTSVAVLIAVSENGELGASLLFLGMAATFGLLALIKVDGKRMSWPWIPAVALAVLGGIVALGSGGVPAIFWAVLLILAGGFMVVRPYLQK
jgi:hypothetical protein